MVSDAVKLEREKRRTAREERMWSLATDPTIKRLALLAGIVGYSAYVSGKGEEAGSTETALAIAMPTVGIPLLAAEAGITDWKVLLALAAACGGIATIASDKAVDAVTIEGPGGYPLVSLLGPVAGLRFVSKEISKRV
jgi:hypothetical protein